MATRCKPGDIVVIIYDEPDCLANVGRLVRVHPSLELNLELNLFCWLIEPLKDDPWYISEVNGLITVKPVSVASQVEHPDAWMLPIKDELSGNHQFIERSISEPDSVNYVMSEEECIAYERIQARIDEALIADGTVNTDSLNEFVANSIDPHTIICGSMCPVTADLSGRVPIFGHGFFYGDYPESDSLNPCIACVGGKP